jgi:hypothetical protein
MAQVKKKTVRQMAIVKVWHKTTKVCNRRSRRMFSGAQCMLNDQNVLLMKRSDKPIFLIAFGGSLKIMTLSCCPVCEVCGPPNPVHNIPTAFLKHVVFTLGELDLIMFCTERLACVWGNMVCRIFLVGSRGVHHRTGGSESELYG